MANIEEGEPTAPRGNEWEVVSLTASAYAAAPGPKQVESSEDDQGKLVGENEVETSSAVLMSRYFVFPPSQLENSPVEPENTEVPTEKGSDDVAQFVGEDRGKSYVKDEDSVSLEGVIADEFPEIHTSYDKIDRFSVSSADFGIDVAFDKERSVYRTAEYSLSSHEATMSKSHTVEKGEGIYDSNEPSLDSALPNFQKSAEGDNYDGSGLPCEAWWKRQALSLYTHAKEANTFWSIFIAATVMGIVVIGNRWQVMHLKWQNGLKDEMMGRMLDPISRFKDAIVGGARRGSLVRGSTSSER